MNNTGKYIIVAGVIIILVGVILYFFPNAFRWFGRLPGDIRVERENSRYYFPIVTMIIVSIVGTIIINVIRKMM